MKIYTKEMIKEKKDKKNKILKVLRIIFVPIIILIIAIILYFGFQKFVLKKANVELLGYKAYIVLTGSMKEDINPGDVVIVKKVTKDNIKEGDVITFSLKRNDSTITHRIIKIEENNGVTEYTTKGDNNSAEDVDKVTFDQIEGRLVKIISKLGYVITKLLTGTGLVIMIIVVVIGYVYSTKKEDRKLAREDARRRFNICKYKKD